MLLSIEVVQCFMGELEFLFLFFIQEVKWSASTVQIIKHLFLVSFPEWTRILLVPLTTSYSWAHAILFEA